MKLFIWKTTTTGDALRTLLGHSDSVTTLAVYAPDNYIIPQVCYYYYSNNYYNYFVFFNNIDKNINSKNNNLKYTITVITIIYLFTILQL